MLSECGGVKWAGEDFSDCFRVEVLQTLLPLIICTISLLHLSTLAVRHACMCMRGYVDDPGVNVVTHVGDQQGEPTDTGHGKSHGALTIQHRKSISALKHGSRRDADDARRVSVSGLDLVEAVVGLGELALSATVTLLRFHLSAYLVANLLQWTYIYALLARSIILADRASPQYWLLKQHRAFLYGCSWVISLLLLRSILIHPHSQRSLALRILDLLLLSLLFIISITSSKETQESRFPGEQPREPVASLFSRATFIWVDPIIWRGYRKTFEISDVGDLPLADKAARVLAGFRKSYKPNKLAVHLLVHHSPELLLQGFWAVCSAVFTFAPTLLLKLLLEYLEDPSISSANAAWLYVILLFVSGFFKAIAEGQASWLGKKITIHLRAIIVGEIFSKTIKRKITADVARPKKSNGGKGEDDEGSATSAAEGSFENELATTGNVTNLMAVDSVKISNVTSFLHLLWASVPAELIIGITLLYNILGYASIAGLAIMIILIPIKIVIARGFSKVQARIMTATDARIQTTNELLQSIRIIKYFAYEDHFSFDVQQRRSVELRRLRQRFVLWTLAVTVYNTTPVLITFFSFLIYTVVERRTLRPSVAFPALSLFALLRIPLDRLAETLASIQEAIVSVNRVASYLDKDETDKYRQFSEPRTNGSTQQMGFRDASFTWAAGGTTDFCMSGVNATFVVDELNVIIGPTGSGKTSLLLALIGEMNLLGGNINYPSNGQRSSGSNVRDFTESVAYCAQRAWLVNESIKQNILFGSSWDSGRYSAVVEACALKVDLQILPAGDNTLIGDKGIKLSGGQKQRVALARAVYSKARYVFLDDCLSAVDMHTGQWIVDHCITGDLMRNRACILITHNVELCIGHARHVIVLGGGKVVAQGSPDAISSSGFLHDQRVDLDLNDEPRPSPSTGSNSTSETHLPVLKKETTQSAVWEGNEAEQVHKAENMAPIPMSVESPVTEIKATGAIKWDLFILYFTASGRWYYWVAMFLMFFANQFSSLSIDLWIREWSNSYHREEIIGVATPRETLILMKKDLFSLTQGKYPVDFVVSKSAWHSFYLTSTAEVNTRFYLGIYAILAMVFMIIKALRMGLLFRGSLSASRKLHSQLLASVVRATFRFYDSTPFGQMINRFSRDLEVIDQELAPVLLGFQHAAFSALTIWTLISITTPLFILPGIFVVFIYFVIGKLYINSSRDLKRIESLQRSPLYQQLDEILAGVVTIRAYGHENRFFHQALVQLDNHSRAFMYLWATNTWLAFRVDVTSALISFLAGAFVVISAGKISPGAAGLSLTYAITFTEHVLWLVRLYAVNEQNMNSVERIKEYIDIVPEAPTEIPEATPPVTWPSEGSVEFVNYSTRYREDLPLALKDISLKVEPGEKVGIVGRTGAGKTSLTSALFRGLEASQGKILIDDIDIGTIGLHDLRRSVTIVPQDPTVFTGTLRSNLDPFELCTDEEIYSALRQVHLTQSYSSLSEPERSSYPSISESANSRNEQNEAGTPLLPPLATPISSGTASPFSLGQCQLICLARALLRQPKILIMDEATASIDHSTDSKVQTVIKDLSYTVITIAHRLQTVLDYDRIVVLDKGEIVEVGTVAELREREGGVFRGMLDGREMSSDDKGKKLTEL